MASPAVHFNSIKVGPRSGASAGSAVSLIKAGTFTWNPASVTAQTAPEASITLATAAAGDLFLLLPPATMDAGLIVQAGHCRVAGTIVTRIANVTAGNLDPASGTWTYIQFRAS